MFEASSEDYRRFVKTRPILLAAALFLASGLVASGGRAGAEDYRTELAARVRQELLHAWRGYERYAWGHDELKPVSRTAKDWYGDSLLMTPVDSLDTLILMGFRDEAEKAKNLIIEKLSFDKDLLTITSASQELGEGSETLDIRYDSEAMSIGLNAQYLLDFLEEAETENVRLELKDENTQCLCRPEGDIEGASRYLYVVMPMRL